jgi:hypothetical protein
MRRRFEPKSSPPRARPSLRGLPFQRCGASAAAARACATIARAAVPGLVRQQAGRVPRARSRGRWRRRWRAGGGPARHGA